MVSTCTLLELVQTVNKYARTDDETVATVAYLINSGKVRLCGTFAGAKIDLSTPAYTTPRLSIRKKNLLATTNLETRQ